MDELPPDALCDVSGRAIVATEPRWRCSNTACDDVHLCSECGGRCPSCGGSGGLYRDGASPFVLRTRVFCEAFSAGDAKRSAAVHPQSMVGRAFNVYSARPLLGEPGRDGSVRWWSYAHVGIAARRVAHMLQDTCVCGAEGAIVICAPNSAGWLVCDWGAALAGVPSIVIDASMPATRALADARTAAHRRGTFIRAVCIEASRTREWRDALHSSSDEAVAMLTTTDAREWLVAAAADRAVDVEGGRTTAEHSDATDA